MVENRFELPKFEGLHPVESGDYLIGTESIDRLVRTVISWIRSGVTGGMVWGIPGLGKTSAIKYMEKVIPKRLGLNVPVIVLNCQSYQRASETIFFSDLLRAAEHGRPNSGTAAMKRSRLVERFAEMGRQSGSNRLVLIADEAQRLNYDEYNWLVDIYNSLASQGIRLIVISVGQPNLLSVRNSFSKSGYAQLIRRFMLNEHRFRGIKSLDEFLSCLAGYDSLEFPRNSGWSYTRYYFPVGGAAGWRLVDCGPALWEAFNELKSNHALKVDDEIPMTDICSSVAVLLQDYRNMDGTEPKIDAKTCRDVVRSAHFLSTEVYRKALAQSMQEEQDH